MSGIACGLALATAVAWSFYGLHTHEQSDTRPVGLEAPGLPVRDVRVLIASDVERLRVRADRPLPIMADQGGLLGACPARQWTVIGPAASGGIRVGADSWDFSSVTLAPQTPGAVWMSVHRNGEWSAGLKYPGTLRVLVGDKGRVDVINHAGIEQYVACVVANEVWPNFDTEAYRAQAIVARSFVLYQMTRRRTAAFDVSATQGSQVYRGVRTDGVGQSAALAARYTRGIVCTWQDEDQERLFCTYYSAACGGMSQSASIFGPMSDIEPLSGGVACDYCKIAPGKTYRWGPVRLSKQAVRSRLVRRYPDLASLGPIRSIEVIERTPSGRPTSLRITGSSGRSRDMLAERFRLTMGANEIRSTDFRIRNGQRHVIFENGRGFGHGLGLCQWGMQAQALEGKRAGEILRYYYPGSSLTCVY